MKLKVFELRWTSQGEKEWVAAHTNIEALVYYCDLTSMSISDFDEEDEIVEVPESQWAGLKIKNIEYHPLDAGDWEETTIAEWMKGKTKPAIIAGTNYE